MSPDVVVSDIKRGDLLEDQGTIAQEEVIGGCLVVDALINFNEQADKIEKEKKDERKGREEDDMSH